MTRRKDPWTFALMSLASTLIVSGAFGQARVGSGHALDHSLRVGDGGYNYAAQRGGPPIQATRYSAYAGRRSAYSPYTGGGTVNIRDGRISNQDVYLRDKGYSAGWQQRPTGSGRPPASAGSNPGAYKIDGRKR